MTFFNTVKPTQPSALPALLLLALWSASAGAYVPTQGDTTTVPNSSLAQRVINFETDKLTVQRAQYLKAEKALRLRQLKKFKTLRTSLSDYPLYPYLLFTELKQRLGSANNDELTHFLTAYADVPVADALRRKILKFSARRGHWKRFLQFYTPQASIRLQCRYLYALIRTGQAETAYPAIQSLWLSGQSRPKTCDRTFRAWRAAQPPSADLVWRRLSLALAEGHRTLARFLTRALPRADKKLAKLWIRLHRTPQQLSNYLNLLKNSPHPYASHILLSTLKRLAARNPHRAEKLWFDPKRSFSIDQQAQYAFIQTLAIAKARRHQPGASEWLSIIPPQQLTDTARAWRVRSALRQSNWPAALTALDALRPETQKKDRWRYWRARILEQLGKKTAAMAHYTRLAQRRSYYGFLAADHTGLPYALGSTPYRASASELFELSQHTAMRRARELFILGRKVPARREWHRLSRNLDERQRLTASKIAQLWGWADQSILTMASTAYRDDIDLRFPLLFQQEVESHSKRKHIDPAWTYGVIRRESAFMTDARSPKGAIGLMQLMPATAKSMATASRARYRGSSQLILANTNLALGTLYLQKMMHRFGGQTVLATAAYNAGARRIDQWLPNESGLDAARWIESIPYRETREYVTSVLAFTVIYADRLGQQPQRLSARMPNIPSREQLRKMRKSG
ncbi:MAG: transglycosylase SLT domain-containing protein [Gammaproteobacteria bacterium]|nr:transglycosylase SLT domain-containing protein [Gammaproteobacteria bacterium]